MTGEERSSIPDAGVLAQAIRRVGETAQNEEEVRIGVEELLAPMRRHLGTVPRYERTYPASVSILGGGSSDAVYGHAVIEYKRPGLLSRKRDLQIAVGGLERYLQGEAAREKGDREKALHRIIGIGLDGQSIFFLRYRGDQPPQAAPELLLARVQPPLFAPEEPTGSFQRLGPYPITEETIAQFLLYLRALRRRPLTPEALAEEFGPKGGIARKMVATLYERLLDALTKPNNPYPKAATFFAEWDRIFGIVYGQDIAKAKKDNSELAKLYGLTGTEELKPLLFAVHTYYALLMKLLAAELASLQSGSLVSSLVADLPALSGRELQDKLTELEDGGLFARLGIRNFLEGDFFGWYLSAWDKDLEESLREMARALSDYEPATGSLQPETTRDLLKKLYQYLIPRELRHDLGEYYTPDWLAELVLNEVGYDGNLDRRLLDPACGSGTFLVLAIRRAREYAEEKLLDPRETVEKVLANIVGFDLNPLAVIAARTNYLLALGSLARHLAGKDIPVYLCDSILTPQTHRVMKRPIEHQKDIPVPSTQKEFWVPEELVDKGQIDVMCRLLEECVAGNYQTEEFLSRGRRELKWDDSLTESALAQLYEKVRRLEAEGRDGLWARIIKNAFAPVFRAVPPFDYVVGNPPWVNWESLADDYREATKELWQSYGLFPHKGLKARLGSAKDDISILMSYVAIDNYLKETGRLGFVITQTVFKTKGGGEGFRRFRLGDNGSPLKVLSVHDLVDLDPFEGASNQTAVVTIKKGEVTEYPVSYTVWQKRSSGKIAVDETLDQVKSKTHTTELVAGPVDIAQTASPWLTTSTASAPALAKAVGQSHYRAYAGACTWMNGVYWLEVQELRPGGLLRVQNLHDIGKASVKAVQTMIERDLVYPLLRGRDIARWNAKPSAYILVPQQPDKPSVGFDESELKIMHPQTYAYLKQFESFLRQRSGFKKFFDPAKAPFYSIYDVGKYTFARYTVMWRQMVQNLQAAVVEPIQDEFLGLRTPITQHVVSLVPFTDRVEAHYFCALVNSVPARVISASYSTGKSYGTPTVLKHIRIPKFNPDDDVHIALARVSEKAHRSTAQATPNGPDLHELDVEVDRLAAQLWGLTEEELAEIQRSLKELG
ncbi:MAG: N-6 DNA methylase [Dehalococcoidia bacterium]|nr:N-6 DNA methylase [Dehalococcoidia bacterium]